MIAFVFCFLLSFSKLWSIGLNLYCFLLLLMLKVGTIWQNTENKNTESFYRKKGKLEYVCGVFHCTSFAFIILIVTPILIELSLHSVRWSLTCYMSSLFYLNLGLSENIGSACCQIKWITFKVKDWILADIFKLGHVLSSFSSMLFPMLWRIYIWRLFALFCLAINYLMGKELQGI